MEEFGTRTECLVTQASEMRSVIPQQRSKLETQSNGGELRRLCSVTATVEGFGNRRELGTMAPFGTSGGGGSMNGGGSGGSPRQNHSLPRPPFLRNLLSLRSSLPGDRRRRGPGYQPWRRRNDGATAAAGSATMTRLVAAAVLHTTPLSLRSSLSISTRQRRDGSPFSLPAPSPSSFLPSLSLILTFSRHSISVCVCVSIEIRIPIWELGLGFQIGNFGNLVINRKGKDNLGNSIKLGG
ncbi:hypothetical protein PIB30_018186 [Stylosanthes scabra]|uniref:Uncharacterized protein n=1 Tax=Stylosanthes scabra TaxID=79078 RepID=A0ABU6S8I4_9FABA|nr:hypothetical protein [Stylosanthes scabra]